MTFSVKSAAGPVEVQRIARNVFWYSLVMLPFGSTMTLLLSIGSDVAMFQCLALGLHLIGLGLLAQYAGTAWWPASAFGRQPLLWTVSATFNLLLAISFPVVWCDLLCVEPLMLVQLGTVLSVVACQSSAVRQALIRMGSRAAGTECLTTTPLSYEVSR